VELMRDAELIDKDLHWIGGKTHFVQVGDVLDRGPGSRKAEDLLIQLTKEAAAAGGRVHALLGNHEVMRMLGDYRYVAIGEYKAFEDKNSSGAREAWLNMNIQDPFVRAETKGQTPLGKIEMIKAYNLDGVYGSWLRSLNA